MSLPGVVILGAFAFAALLIAFAVRASTAARSVAAKRKDDDGVAIAVFTGSGSAHFAGAGAFDSGCATSHSVDCGS